MEPGSHVRGDNARCGATRHVTAQDALRATVSAYEQVLGAVRRRKGPANAARLGTLGPNAAHQASTLRVEAFGCGTSAGADRL